MNVYENNKKKDCINICSLYSCFRIITNFFFNICLFSQKGFKMIFLHHNTNLKMFYVKCFIFSISLGIIHIFWKLCSIFSHSISTLLVLHTIDIWHRIMFVIIEFKYFFLSIELFQYKIRYHSRTKWNKIHIYMNFIYCFHV